jgi:hypothetical protein
MKIRLIRSYRKLNKNGQPTTVFVYSVNGTDEQLAAYKEAQGENYRESDDGEPLWFSTRCVGDSGSLITTSKGTFAPDMSAFDKAASLATQYGGNLGQELARNAAASLLSSSNAPAASAVAAPAPSEKKAVDKQ